MAMTALALASALTVAACATRVDTHGNLPDPDRMSQIKPGKTQAEVQQLIGSPSSVAAFDRKTWYYISQRNETFAIFKPEVDDRKILVIRFDDKGVVETVDSLGLEEAKNIKPVERVTPTAGNELTVIEQMLGNFGRFNKKPPSNPSPTGGPGGPAGPSGY